MSRKNLALHLFVKEILLRFNLTIFCKHVFCIVVRTTIYSSLKEKKTHFRYKKGERAECKREKLALLWRLFSLLYKDEAILHSCHKAMFYFMKKMSKYCLFWNSTLVNCALRISISNSSSKFSIILPWSWMLFIFGLWEKKKYYQTLCIKIDTFENILGIAKMHK